MLGESPKSVSFVNGNLVEGGKTGHHGGYVSHWEDSIGWMHHLQRGFGWERHRIGEFLMNLISLCRRELAVSE